jgi:crooked neck
MTNNTVEEGLNNINLARRIYERGNNSLKSNGDKESRALLLESWRDFENEFGDEENCSKIALKMPRRVKQKKRLVAENGVNIINYSNFI